MAERLDDALRGERGEAIRHLLATPWLDITASPAPTRLAIRHAEWLIEWFENVCGWRLEVDAPAGFARLYKRSANPDSSRPLRRPRGERAPFDRRRYRLLCLVCAVLERHPVTTIGLLADGLRAEAALDTTLRRERAAIVDVLHVLRGWGVIAWRAGDVDAWLDDETSNAILQADSHRLHSLLASAITPGRIDAALAGDTTEAIVALLAEPRYGDAPDDPAATPDAQRLRFTRHALARRTLDDPVVHLEDESRTTVDYLENPAGRRWLREHVEAAGFALEERREGLLAIDPDAIATDLRFPGPSGTAAQVALMLIDALSGTAPIDAARTRASRTLGTLSAPELDRFIASRLQRHTGWARMHREGEGPRHLVREAVDLLRRFDLVRTDEDGRVHARPALARYRVVESEKTVGASAVNTPGRRRRVVPSAGSGSSVPRDDDGDLHTQTQMDLL